MKIPVGLLLCITAACFSALQDTASASGVCSMSGAGHYHSFDGTTFDYQGTCQLNFSSDCNNDTQDVAIVVNFEYRYSRQDVSFLSYVTVSFGAIVIIIGHYPTPDDPVVVIVIEVTNVTVPLPYNGTGFTVIEVVTSDGYNSITLDVTAYGIQVSYTEWEIMWIVDDSYKSKMCGMCGNFNDDPADDLIDNTFNANSYYPNPGRAWGDHWVVDQISLTARPTPNDIPNCTDNSYACSDVCDYLADSTGIFSSIVTAIGPTRAWYFKEICRIDACVTNGDSLRRAIRHFLNWIWEKVKLIFGKTTIAGFPLNYTRYWRNDARCDCSSYPKSCRLHIPLCGYWCDCIGVSSGNGTLYECWDEAVDGRCYMLADSAADTCTAISGIPGHSSYPFIP